jgi:hypothetical protein
VPRTQQQEKHQQQRTQQLQQNQHEINQLQQQVPLLQCGLQQRVQTSVPVRPVSGGACAPALKVQLPAGSTINKPYGLLLNHIH